MQHNSETVYQLIIDQHQIKIYRIQEIIYFDMCFNSILYQRKKVSDIMLTAQIFYSISDKY